MVEVERQAVTVTTDPTQFQSYVASLPVQLCEEDPLYGAFGRAYYPAVFGARLENRTFLLSTPGGASLLVECDLLDGRLGRFGMPIRMIATDAEPGTRRKLIRVAVKMLLSIAAERSASTAVVADLETHELLSQLGLACLAARGRMQVRLHAVLDLSRSEQELRSDVRKSAKSLFNWGRRSLELRYCNASACDRAVFEDYRRLHGEVAGRVTRGDESWNAMFDAVRDGRGELTTVFLEGALVGGMLVVDGSRCSYYASGAYLRSRFDRPLAHWPLMDAILRARLRGLRLFDVGELPSPGEVTRKEETIGMFKKAFTSRIEARKEWLLPAAVEPTEERARDGTDTG